MFARFLLLMIVLPLALDAGAAESQPKPLTLQDDAAIRETLREQREAAIEHQRQQQARIRQLRQDLRREMNMNREGEPPVPAPQVMPEARNTEAPTWSERQPQRLQRLSPEERSRLRQDVREVWHDRPEPRGERGRRR